MSGEAMYYINYFFIFSVLGHFIESFFYASKDSGILLGYWTPIYGIGVILILIIYKFINKLKLSNILKGCALFLITMIVLSSIEAIGGYLIKWIFNTELWNYTNHQLNIGRYTSLEMSLIWGFSSILLIYFIKPLIDKIIKYIPKWLTYLLIIIFIIDLIATLTIKGI